MNPVHFQHALTYVNSCFNISSTEELKAVLAPEVKWVRDTNFSNTLDEEGINKVIEVFNDHVIKSFSDVKIKDLLVKNSQNSVFVKFSAFKEKHGENGEHFGRYSFHETTRLKFNSENLICKIRSRVQKIEVNKLSAKL